MNSRSLRTALVTVALALTATVGAVSADVLVPAVDAGGSGGGGVAFDPPTQNERSIALTEGKEPTVAVARSPLSAS